MIEIRYKRILFFQAFFLIMLGTFLYNFFKRSFDLKVGAVFWGYYLLTWFIFIVFNLLFLKIFALPTKGLLKKLEGTTLPEDLSWSVIEDTLSKRDVHQQLLQTEYEIENLKYKILLDSLHDPVCIFGKDQSILYANHSFDQLFNIPVQSKKGTLLEVSRNHEFHDFVRKCIETNEVHKLHEFSFNPLQDSFKKFFEITVFPLKEVQNYLCIMHDMTERKLADQIREDFVSNFSHEVRTPLTILNGQTQTLKMQLERDDSFEEKYRPIFDKIDKNSRRLLALFNDLLTLSSVEKKKNLKKEEVSISSMTMGLVEEMKYTYPHKKIHFTFDFQTEIFYVDYNLFEQVLINLIDNAYKYVASEGHVHLRSHEEGSSSIFEIADDGAGIPEEHRHRVFERFFRVDSSRSSETPGTGLGLAIVKHIIQKHDGKIKIGGNRPTGTIFTIVLPKKS